MTDLKDQLQHTLGDNYTIERELGGGGMSRVFVAEEVSLGRKVVVKVLPPDLAASVNVERFRREIQLAARLQHPHIVPVLAAGISNGLPYYTMPFIEGESLRASLARSGELPVQEVAKILRDVLSALAYAHAHGVVHRDIKPDNVLLTDHHAVVADFGLAKALSASTNPGSSLTSLGVALGTPAYMAPEQATADPTTDHRADLYAVGAMAYEMLTGHQVFSARSPQAMVAAHALEEPEPIGKRRPSVPPELSSLIMRALEKHAADRPQSAGEMLAELEAAVTPSGATTPHIGAIRRRASKKSDRSGLFMAVGAALVLLTLASSSWYWYDHRTRVVAAAAADTTPSLAVLPFENLGKADDAYFAAGMTDEISSKLAVLGGLTVIGRQSAKSYANTTKPAQQIGKELGATYLLTGTVRWDRSRLGRRLVKITPVLQRASSGAEIWSEPYQGEATGVFDIQGKVAERVAEAMRVNLSQTDKQALTARPTNNAEAYDYYLRAKNLGLGTQRASEFLRAVAFLERAVQLDPKFALAYATLGVAHLNIYWFQGDDSPHRLEMAKAVIDTALALDPKLAAGYRATATYYYRTKLDYPRALDALAVAERLAPNDPNALDLKALIERRQNRWAESISDEEHASRLDPRNPDLFGNLCLTLYVTRRYDEAEKACRQAIVIAPDKWPAYGALNALLISRSGDIKTALAVLRQAESRVDPEDFREGLLGSAWPALLDPHLLSEMNAARSPPELQVRLSYLSSKLLLSVYEKDPRTAGQFADSVLALGPQALRGNFFDSDVHAELALAYAAKGDKQRRSEEARLSMKTTPLSVDAVRGYANLVILAYSAVLAGSYDEAFSDLKQLLAIPSTISPALLRTDPWFEPIRRDPRFKQLVSGP